MLTLASEGPPAEKLRAAWKEIDSERGISVKMHLPPESGEGRGPLGGRIVKPGDSDYPMIVKVKLDDAGFEVKHVQPKTWASAPAGAQKLRVSRSGKRLGTIDFSKDPPTLESTPDEVDARFLKSHWEEIMKQERLTVRYHEPKDGIETLVTLVAKRGDAAYPDAVRLYLMLYEQYDDQRRYVLELVP